jgi:hypothetical protein
MPERGLTTQMDLSRRIPSPLRSPAQTPANGEPRLHHREAKAPRQELREALQPSRRSLTRNPRLHLPQPALSREALGDTPSA